MLSRSSLERLLFKPIFCYCLEERARMSACMRIWFGPFLELLNLGARLGDYAKLYLLAP